MLIWKCVMFYFVFRYFWYILSNFSLLWFHRFRLLLTIRYLFSQQLSIRAFILGKCNHYSKHFTSYKEIVGAIISLYIIFFQSAIFHPRAKFCIRQVWSLWRRPINLFSNGIFGPLRKSFIAFSNFTVTQWILSSKNCVLHQNFEYFSR